jgi:hypothetical protein
MYRYLSVAVLGFAGFLAVPQASQAQVPVGVQVQVGPAGFTYQPGYTYVAPRYVVPAPVVVTSPVVVTRPAVYPWYWDGYRWIRRERWEHFHHYGHHR